MRSSDLSARTALVGRIRELDTFRAALRKVATGSARLIRVSGATGSGRTRLLQEFATLAAAQHAVSVRTRAGGPDDAPLGSLLDAEILGSLPEFIEALKAPAGDADPFDGLLKALADASRAAPVWLLLDDLHAADEATQAFAERLTAAVCHGSLRECRVGVVLSLLAGGGSRALRDRLDAQDRRGGSARLALTGLGEDEIRQWLQQRFEPAADDALVRLLGDASGGNPLLLTELMVYLQRTGILRVEGNRLTARPQPGDGANQVTLPPDLSSLLREKISAISGDCRRAMTLAAFVGNEFDSSALADLLQQDRARLDSLVEEARIASLVERGEGHKVCFKHAAARELFYATPEPRRREETHLQVCEGLIGEFGERADEHCLTITHHLLRAGARADPRLVLRFAPPAADAAFRHHAYFLAGRYYTAAARAGRELLPPERRAALYCRAGEAFQRWSDGPRSSDCFQQAVTLYEACEDLVGYATALQGLLRNLISFGEAGEEATAVAGRLQGLLSNLPDDAVELKVRVHDTLAGYYHNAARYDLAEGCAQTAMNIARNSDDPTLRCIPVTSLAMAQMEQLRLTDARTTWLEGLSYDRAAGASRYEGLHLQRLPVPLYCIGETQQAARYNQASYHHNQPIGNTGELCLNLGVDVMIANLRGDFDVAISAGREAMELMAITRYLWNAPTLVGALAYALVMRRRFEEAEGVIAHLSTSGLTFKDPAPYRSTAARLTQLLFAHRGLASSDRPSAGGAAAGRPMSGVRVGSLARLCSEAELALFQNRPDRLSGVHDALEYVHRRGLVLSLGWCCSVPRALAVSTALRSGLSRARPYFAQASQFAERCHAPLEQGRVELYRGLTALRCEDADMDETHRDLDTALDCFRQHDAPALAALAEDGLTRLTARSATPP